MVNKQVKIFVSYFLLPNKEAVQCYIIFISLFKIFCHSTLILLSKFKDCHIYFKQGDIKIITLGLILSNLC